MSYLDDEYLYETARALMIEANKYWSEDRIQPETAVKIFEVAAQLKIAAQLERIADELEIKKSPVQGSDTGLKLQ